MTDTEAYEDAEFNKNYRHCTKRANTKPVKAFDTAPVHREAFAFYAIDFAPVSNDLHVLGVI